jgi:hypothetical protein
MDETMRGEVRAETERLAGEGYRVLASPSGRRRGAPISTMSG